MNETKILIVEDETVIDMEIEYCLHNFGYQVTSIANSGEEAIQKADEDKPDLILMDIRIQGEQDGIEVAEIIREKFGIPVVFSTAHLDKEKIERAKITMPFGYVLKPIQERDLKVTLEMALYAAKVDAERKRVVEILQRNEALLNDTQKIARIGGWEIDLEKNVNYWTREMYRIHNLNPDQFIQSENKPEINGLPENEFPVIEEAVKLSLSCYLPADRERLMKAYTNCMENAQEYDLEFSFTSCTGVKKRVRTKTIPVIKKGKVVKMRGILQDITPKA
jgi:CheY-like chemotaxis protein